ncbi:MAG: LuxR C-terminal-related transcriptional regulator, partial [Actinomycetota bacterium]
VSLDQAGIWASGETPSDAAALALASACTAADGDPVLVTANASTLPGVGEGLGSIAGIVAVRVGRRVILWTAPEVERTLVWGGATPDMVAADKRMGVYYPRYSFSRWIAERRGCSAPWPRWVPEEALVLARGLEALARTERPDLVEFRLRLARLTEREKTILADIARGLTTKVIALKYGISNRTVDGHRIRISGKLGVSGLSNLTRLTLEAGLLDAPTP